MDRAILISPNTVFSSYLHRETLSTAVLLPSLHSLMFRHTPAQINVIGAEEGSRGRRTPEFAYPTFPTLASHKTCAQKKVIPCQPDAAS